MLKKNFSILIMILVIVGLRGNVFGKDTYTATSTINGIKVNWEYQLNEKNQIENLKCINPVELRGNITIPSALDGKTIISLGSSSFRSATNLTSLTIPSSIKKINYRAFEKCDNLTSVNLGQIEDISFDVFKDCPKLTKIELPKTLKYGADNGIFTGTTKLTSVTFEEGTTEIVRGILKNCKNITKVTIPNSVIKIGSGAFSNSGLTEIKLPNSVKEIDYYAFEKCDNLTSVNLGQIEDISFDVFKDCPKLTKIELPKTLKYGADNGIFTGTTKLTSVTFEEGTTEIVRGILKNCKNITKVTIPNSVIKIGSGAFSNSGLTEIKLPNSVKEIDYYAFENCSNLTKVTILDNCTQIGWFSLYPNKDTVFNNHNDNLTIYCYKDSKISDYAKANNIKYVYLTRTTTEINTEKQKEKEQNKETKPTNITNSNQKPKVEDTTIAKGILPKTGVYMTIVYVIISIFIISFVLYKKYNNYKDVK